MGHHAGKIAKANKAGDIRAAAQYEIHEPAQDVYGDWASISIDRQYYLFCDHIGQGHPDIMFAEGQFYLITQTPLDFVSPGPWVDGVEVRRVGVDTNNDDNVNQWADWQSVQDKYKAVPGFAKQVAKIPAQLDLRDLPAGYGFQFKVRLTNTTKNKSKPILDQVEINFPKAPLINS